ncbi:hypothetical protein Clacol_004370 [Clathrus columnatus]|uniref:Uncharacterized protein n=1 Tax=Clathrus columnatus TaxID=1419009 RepID=A0AAV5AA88_9AGAM|nr:hypothetical protein Clacol_004370 [Clathrus columnatus]
MLQRYSDVLHNPYTFTLLLVHNITTLLSDVLAFIAIIRQIWGLWKEKRRLHLHTNKDLVTLLLQQVNSYRDRLSTILICEFTLDLRRRNTAKSLPNQSALELPELNLLSSQNNPARPIQHVLNRLQENIILDMGEQTDEVGIDDSGEEEPIPETA